MDYRSCQSDSGRCYEGGCVSLKNTCVKYFGQQGKIQDSRIQILCTIEKRFLIKGTIYVKMSNL